jgi:ribonuclease HI
MDRMCSFHSIIDNIIHQEQVVPRIIFQLLQVLLSEEASLLSSVLWSIWKQRNNRIWNDTVDAQSFVVERARSMFFEWQTVRKVIQKPSQQASQTGKTNWVKPNAGRYKCNIDAAFSNQHNRVGIGMCIRDEMGAFVLAKTEWFNPICEVHIGEALGLLSALNWVHELQLGPVDFELDSKRVVDQFSSPKSDVSEFGDIIDNCRALFTQFYVNSSVEFVRRQANEAAHSLAREAALLANFQILVTIPNCIEHILINEMI